MGSSSLTMIVTSVRATMSLSSSITMKVTSTHLSVRWILELGQVLPLDVRFFLEGGSIESEEQSGTMCLSSSLSTGEYSTSTHLAVWCILELCLQALLL